MKEASAWLVYRETHGIEIDYPFSYLYNDKESADRASDHRNKDWKRSKMEANWEVKRVKITVLEEE